MECSIKCHVCNTDMFIYYQSFSVLLHSCNNCGHFTGNVYINDHKTKLFDKLYSFKKKITNKVFYESFYNKYSYMLLNISDLKKIKLQNVSGSSTVVYILCDSYDNLYNANSGSYQFFTTNSIKYVGSYYHLNLNNVYIIKDTNKTIYEFLPYETKSNEIINMLYNEIRYNLYNDNTIESG